MKLLYIEIDATAEEIKANMSIADSLRNALCRISNATYPVQECESEEEDEG